MAINYESTWKDVFSNGSKKLRLKVAENNKNNKEFQKWMVDNNIILPKINKKNNPKDNYTDWYALSEEQRKARVQKNKERRENTPKEIRQQEARMRYERSMATGVRQAWVKRRRSENPELCMWNSARSRAKIEGLEFNIEVSDIRIPKLCPVFKTPLLMEGKSANSISIDRIDSSKGYVKGNVCVISNKANRQKNDSTIEDLSAILRYMKRMRRRNGTGCST